MTETVKIVSPVDGRVYAERPGGRRPPRSRRRSARAKAARRAWGEVTVRERAKFLNHFVDALLATNDEIVPELAWQMGRPVRYGGEKRKGVEERARYMIDLAETAAGAGRKDRQGRFQALDRARAAGHRHGDRAVELPIFSPRSTRSCRR